MAQSIVKSLSTDFDNDTSLAFNIITDHCPESVTAGAAVVNSDEPIYEILERSKQVHVALIALTERKPRHRLWSSTFRSRGAATFGPPLGSECRKAQSRSVQPTRPCRGTRVV